MTIDTATLTAIDVHVHLEAPDPSETDAAARKYFGDSGAGRDTASLAEYYRSRKLACVVFTVDERLSGRRQVSNDDVLAFAVGELRHRHSVRQRRSDAGPGSDPRSAASRRHGTGPRPQAPSTDAAVLPERSHRLSAVRDLRRGATAGAVSHRATAASAPARPAAPASGLKYGHPMPIDDVAVDFPEMPIIMAHPSFPWQDEAISVCLHKPTVYIDLSGWSPKYFSPTLDAVREQPAENKSPLRIGLSRGSHPTAGCRTSRRSGSRTRCGR